MPENSEASPEAAALLATLGMRVVSSGDGRATIALSVDARHLRSFDMLHGGVSAALLDTALGFAVMSTAEADQGAVTTQLNIHFTRPARRGDRLTAAGEVVHRGGGSAVARGEIRRDDETLIAMATGSFQFVSRN